MSRRIGFVFAVVIAIAIALPAHAQSIPDYDFQWATIGAVGNEPFPGPPFTSSYGRGGVNYEYRISKLEITTAQWMEFMNAFPDQFTTEQWPGSWGARPLSFGNGTRWALINPNTALIPVNGVTWRDAAKYCNWLHNGKTPELWAIQSGAYDVSTFGDQPDFSITDQREHSPDAKFWIPTLDEYLKAAHYDPDKYGDGKGGWWNYPTTSDTAPTPGYPGEPGAQTSAGLFFDGTQPSPLGILLGSYPDVQSPWGLLDTSGGAREWTEEFIAPGDRLVRGSAAGDSTYDTYDHVGFSRSRRPSSTYATLRIASAVPSSATVSSLFFSGLFIARRRRARNVTMTAAIGVLVTVLASAQPAHAQSIPDYDFQWATIGAVGNPNWDSQGSGSNIGRGQVNYEYRISKMEITSAQWLEFVNTIGPLDPVFTTQNLEPVVWGGRHDFNYPDGYRYRYRNDAPVPELVPLSGITWRAAAMYCNWLHNDKAPALWAIQSGAYDTNTFTYDPKTREYGDQPAHSPDAKYWIPTLDEWMKAVYYDQDRYGENQGGWWTYPNASDTPLISGWPDEPGAQTSAGAAYSVDGQLAAFIPLGSYPDVQSPWGLLDASGGASEWTESWLLTGWRQTIGSEAANSPSDHIWYSSSNQPTVPFHSFRVASRVPAPGGVAVLSTVVTCFTQRRRALPRRAARA